MSGLTSESPVRPAPKPLTGNPVMVPILAVVMLIMYARSFNTWYLVVLGVLAIPYIYLWIALPIRFHQSNWHDADHSSEPFDPNEPEIPEPVSSTIRSLGPEMEALGYASAGHFRRSRMPLDHELFLTLLINRKSKQAARMGMMLSRAGNSTRSRTVLGFTTSFTDGTWLSTTNLADDVSLTGLREGSMAFPGSIDLHRLHEIHQKAVDRYCGDAIRRDPSSTKPEVYLRESIARAMDGLVEKGYYYLDQERRVFRPTWKGAILTNCKLRWPIKPIRATLRRKREARLLRELGIDPS